MFPSTRLITMLAMAIGIYSEQQVPVSLNELKKMVGENSGVVIYIGGSYCVHCVKLFPKVEELARRVKESDKRIKFLLYKNKLDDEVCRRYSEKYIPLLFVLVGSIDKRDARKWRNSVGTVDDLERWLDSAVKPVCHEVSTLAGVNRYLKKNKEEIKRNNGYLLAAYLTKEDAKSRLEIDQALRYYYNRANHPQEASRRWACVIFSAHPGPASHVKLEKLKRGKKDLGDDLEEIEIMLKPPIAADDLGEQLFDYSFTFIETALSAEILSPRKGALHIVVIPGTKENYKELSNALKKAVFTLLKGKYAVKPVILVEETDHPYFINQGIPLDVPALFFLNYYPKKNSDILMDNKYYQPCDLSYDSITETIEKLLVGKIPVFCQSSPDPSDDGPLKIINSKNFGNVVLEPKNAFLVLLYNSKHTYDGSHEYQIFKQFAQNQLDKTAPDQSLVTLAIDLANNDLPFWSKFDVPAVIGYQIGPKSLNNFVTYDLRFINLPQLERFAQDLVATSEE